MHTTESIKCPKCSHINTLTPRSLHICEACGFDLDMHRFNKKAKAKQQRAPKKDSHMQRFWSYITAANLKEEPTMFYARIVVFAVMVGWGIHFIKMGYGVDYRGFPEINNSFMHLINLPVHEAGHIIFQPFGRLIMFLGGSLMQLLLPLGIMFFFVFKSRDNFSAALALWWVAQSLKDVVPYINDARALKIMLLTGPAAQVPHTHDWRQILMSTGLLEYDAAIAAGANFISGMLFFISFIWGAAVLMNYYRDHH